MFGGSGRPPHHSIRCGFYLSMIGDEEETGGYEEKCVEDGRRARRETEPRDVVVCTSKETVCFKTYTYG